MLPWTTGSKAVDNWVRRSVAPFPEMYDRLATVAEMEERYRLCVSVERREGIQQPSDLPARLTCRTARSGRAAPAPGDEHRGTLARVSAYAGKAATALCGARRSARQSGARAAGRTKRAPRAKDGVAVFQRRGR